MVRVINEDRQDVARSETAEAVAVVGHAAVCGMVQVTLYPCHGITGVIIAGETFDEDGILIEDVYLSATIVTDLADIAVQCIIIFRHRVDIDLRQPVRTVLRAGYKDRRLNIT